MVHNKRLWFRDDFLEMEHLSEIILNFDFRRCSNLQGCTVGNEV